MRLIFGRVKSQEKGRIRVILAGYQEDVEAEALALVGGQSDVQAWLPYNQGDLVAVLMDEENPENAVVLGGVWADSGVLSASKNGEIAFRAEKVSAFKSSIDNLSAASRDDKVQTELTGIKNALDSLVTSFNSHIHPSPSGATSAPTVPASNDYTVGQTASDVVFIE